MNVFFCGLSCDVNFVQYTNGQTGIRLVAAEEDPDEYIFKGSPVATATTCVEKRIPYDAGEVVIKEYSENAGMVEALRKGGFIEDEVRWFDFGMGLHTYLEVDTQAAIALCRLTKQAKELAISQGLTF